MNLPNRSTPLLSLVQMLAQSRYATVAALVDCAQLHGL